MANKNIEWKVASNNSKVTDINIIESTDGRTLMTVSYTLPAVETTFTSVYTIYGNGVVKIDNTLNSTAFKGDIPRIGMRLQLPKKITT